jgi:hypothetical protein
MATKCVRRYLVEKLSRLRQTFNDSCTISATKQPHIHKEVHVQAKRTKDTALRVCRSRQRDPLLVCGARLTCSPRPFSSPTTAVARHLPKKEKTQCIEAPTQGGVWGGIIGT